MSELDIHIIPPTEYPVTHAIEITTVDVEINPIVPVGINLINGPVWVSFMSNVDWYCIFSDSESDPYPDPVITARDPSTNVCWRVPANFEFQRKIDLTSNRMKVITGSDGVLRWTMASKQGV
ncbi:MAG: hypothetical protein ACYSWP_17795 [Planctomycetota bacterium]|jgi:hypothetical protein